MKTDKQLQVGDEIVSTYDHKIYHSVGKITRVTKTLALIEHDVPETQKKWCIQFERNLQSFDDKRFFVRKKGDRYSRLSYTTRSAQTDESTKETQQRIQMLAIIRDFNFTRMDNVTLKQVVDIIHHMENLS